MIDNKYCSSLSTEITSVKYSTVKNYLSGKKIIHLNLAKSKDDFLHVNNDLQLEGDCKFWGKVNTLFSIGCFSYTSSNMGYGVRIGRYSSISRGLKIMGAHHFPEWISTSPFFYSEDFHDLEAQSISHLERTRRRINIGNDVWIGADVVLKSCINIGDGAIIASNSVVTKDVPPFSIVGGTPAKIIRPRFSDKVMERIMKTRWWRFHLNDLKGLMANNPEQFLSELEERILLQKLEEYKPQIITRDDVMRNVCLD